MMQLVAAAAAAVVVVVVVVVAGRGEDEWYDAMAGWGVTDFDVEVTVGDTLERVGERAVGELGAAFAYNADVSSYYNQDDWEQEYYGSAAPAE
jgi:hypothetical protein